MTDRLQIVDDINDPNLKPETRAMPGQNNNFKHGVSKIQECNPDVSLRRFRCKALLLDGASPEQVMEKLDISEAIFYKDMTILGSEMRARDTTVLLALMMTRYEQKRMPIVEELKRAKTPWITARMVEILETIDKNFNDFLFKSGLITVAPAREFKKIIIEFGTSDAELERIAYPERFKDAKGEAINASFSASGATTFEGADSRDVSTG
ncbi:MAG: hypothetical protein ABIF85_06150 [Nanoarchaeota archaeon]